MTSDSLVTLNTCCGPLIMPARYRGMIKNVVDRDEYGLRKVGFQPALALDLGASFGPATLLMKTLWPACRVIAFEPHPPRANLWRKNVGHLPGVELIEAALIYGDDDRVQFIAANMARHGRQTTTLAASCPRLPDLIKIDIEGAETGVLAELAALNWRVPHIVGEWHFAAGLSAVGRLGQTHHVEIHPARGQAQWGLFRATQSIR